MSEAVVQAFRFFLPTTDHHANNFSPYFHYFSSFLKTQYSVLLFNRLIVPALSNFKACAENVGSKNRTKWLYLFRNKSPISAPLQQELMTPHHQSQTECDDSTKVGLFDFFPFFNPSSVRDHFGWSGSWPAGTSSPPPAPPPPLQLVQATNHQKILA